MDSIKLVLSVMLLTPVLWGCEDDAFSKDQASGGEVVRPQPGIDISDVELTPEQQDLLAVIEGDIKDNNYGAAATNIVRLLEAHPDSEQITLLYSDVLARQSGIAPSHFALRVGARPVRVRDEDGEWVEKVSSTTFANSVIDLADVEDTDDYQVRFLNGRHALALRLQGKTVAELPSQEQADIGAMATIHATRLAYAAVGGKASAESLNDEVELRNALDAHLSRVNEELTETLDVVFQTSDAVQRHYPVQEVNDSPIRMSLAKNAFTNTMLDDGALSAEEVMEVVRFAPGM